MRVVRQHTLFVTDEEWATIRRAAEESGKTIRAAIMDAITGNEKGELRSLRRKVSYHKNQAEELRSKNREYRDWYYKAREMYFEAAANNRRLKQACVDLQKELSELKAGTRRVESLRPHEAWPGFGYPPAPDGAWEGTREIMRERARRGPGAKNTNQTTNM